ncbi:MAG: sulfur carrier protein ThiS adenylyltransferase ThiF [Ruminococcus sp.]|nr:sulfur carrier protein ThiS adenylyltransferase ThiF [Ruminococcus sp.]MBR1752685.1 sulfur carrier protein ThiS adenylyltransferase ThiF [Ruminococcus sp.]
MIPAREEMYKALEERHGKDLQEKLQAASVAVCGLGGLGSNVAIHLARAGVGRLHLIDFDSVDLSNLNRQQYFPDQLGQPKAQALYDTIKRIAPYCDLTFQSVKLTEDNIPTLLSPFDIIAECFDKADQKAMLVNCVLEKMNDKYLVAASGMAGLSSANEIRTRKISKRFYMCGDGVNGLENGLGLISARVAVCASHEAVMILRIIAGEYGP